MHLAFLFLREGTVQRSLCYADLLLELLKVVLDGLDGFGIVLLMLSFDPPRRVRSILLGILVRHDKLLLLLVLHLYLLQLLLDELIEPLKILMPNVSLYGNLVDLCEEVGLIDIGMHVGVMLVVLEVMLLHLPLSIIQQNLDLFHIDDAVNLASSELTKPILAALQHCLLVHPALLPIVRNVLLLQFFFEGRLAVLEVGDIDADLVGGDLSF